MLNCTNDQISKPPNNFQIPMINEKSESYKILFETLVPTDNSLLEGSTSNSFPVKSIMCSCIKSNGQRMNTFWEIL